MSIKEKLKREYLENWEKFSSIVKEGKLEPIKEKRVWLGRETKKGLVSKYQDLDIGNPPFLAAVFMLPSGVWESIQRIQADLEKVDPNQKYYHPYYFHITLEEYGWEDQIDLEELLETMKTILSKYSSFDIQLKGLNCFPRTIYVQVFDPSQTFLRIFEDIRSSFSNLEEKPFEYIPHVSIAEILSNEASKLISLIAEKYRKTYIGKIKVEKIHIVRARPHLTVGRIEMLAEIPLK
ncbi:MAG: 2'-5' RNA ligase family protein [Candidatus Hodarchaeota archaeon]